MEIVQARMLYIGTKRVKGEGEKEELGLSGEGRKEVAEEGRTNKRGSGRDVRGREKGRATLKEREMEVGWDSL
jgi:hypothetical protein